MSRGYFIYTTTIFILFTILLNSCGQSKQKKTDRKVDDKTIEIDSSKIAIIPFNIKDKYPFDNTYLPVTLTQSDINDIDSLLLICVTNYNLSFDKDLKSLSIDLEKHDYYKQIIAVKNKKGEKEVWVNCFCHIWDSNKWKTEILIVHDGGNCYFNFKINLTKKIYYDLDVNGEA